MYSELLYKNTYSSKFLNQNFEKNFFPKAHYVVPYIKYPEYVHDLRYG